MKKTKKVVTLFIVICLCAIFAGKLEPANAVHSDTVLEGARVIYSGTFENRRNIFAVS